MKPGQWPGLRTRIVAQMSMAGALFALPQVAVADDEIRTSADVTASGGWSSNPFSEAGGDHGSAYVEVNVRPVISLVAEHSVITLSGLLNYQHYFRDYADSDDYGGTLDYSGTLSSRLTVHADAHYDSSIIGGFDTFTTVIDPTQPQPPVTTGPDIALVGTRDRRRTLSFGGDLAYSLSSYDSLTANAYYTQNRYGGQVASNYNSYGGGVGYSRRLSSHLQIGLQGSASRYDYQGLFGNSQVYSVQATFKDALSDRWNVSGAAGVSFSDQSLGGKQKNFTGNIQLCRQSPRATLCLFASDAVLPTGYAGTVNSKSAGVTYSYRLTERSTFNLSGQYSNNGQPIDRQLLNPVNIADSYLTLGAGYDRQLTQRVHFVASTHYRKLVGGGLNHTSADYGGSLGILVRFGDSR